MLSAGLYALCFENGGALVKIAQIQIDIWRPQEMVPFHNEMENVEDPDYKSKVSAYLKLKEHYMTYHVGSVKDDSLNRSIK